MKTYFFNGFKFFNVIMFVLVSGISTSQNKPVNDVTKPLHLLQPDYPTPYGPTSQEKVIETLNSIYRFLDKSTPTKIIDKRTQEELSQLNDYADFAEGLFRLTSYEWGVTYAGMLLAGQETQNEKFSKYTIERLNQIAVLAKYFKSMDSDDIEIPKSIHSVLHPKALDDAGAICAAMIKLKRLGKGKDLDPLIKNFIDYISFNQYRLKDGTLARNRPQANTLWLDDLFMSVPALAQMGKLTGEKKYYDDAVKQVLQFSERMFNSEKGLYMHGWVQDMEMHPQYHWARANGWAIMAIIELLDVLPESHSGYPLILKQLKLHSAGLSKFQDQTGFWHQLIDRNDSYLETSATAIFTYSLAKAINKGLIDKKAYSPVVLLAWNAISTKVSQTGEVEGTCVGTGMGFDPAFYYNRPIHIFAAHGYGPVILAGAEILHLIKNNEFEINDSSLQLKYNKM
ncbi:glycoside hydrolase family 88/105 protein [Aestuariibaculum sediminum]|uniref:Glycoside hydrolase family 88 protein n=1 Tax=Aestuariibaculum sediminum TaxID=2770637 RepID=A0A8J6Q067_9FLAO|nr:glycoside hydrolase family 88 protein [Aestuariibaculum sediminum]MBD0832192.1 glycoside hydrolase family 88 protein [Aestuariibaculum sediminum]